MRARAFHCFIAALVVSLSISLAKESGAPVPQEKIDALETAFKASKDEKSAARKRLSVKRVIRDGDKLLGLHSAAPNRFEVIGLLFRARQQMFSLDDSSSNRAALLKVGQELVKAPDEYAGLRLDADFLLLQADLARKGANAKERLLALKSLVTRYRDTSAEAEMLRVAMIMALELGDARLISYLGDEMALRFAGDLEMINFQRRKLKGQILGSPFRGKFQRSDGGVMHLPADALGKVTVLYFWSKDDPTDDHVQRLAAEWKKQRDEITSRINIISFNVDDLPDAGENILRDLGVNWPALHLPGGRENPFYKTFPQKDPAMMTMTPTGYVALIMSGSTRRRASDTGKTDFTRWFQSSLAREWSRERYTNQLTSLFAGDFFVVDPEGPFDPTLPPELKALSSEMAKPMERTATSVPEETLRAIQDCFVQSPLRYRMAVGEIRSAYQKAEKLCAKAIEDYPNAPDLWIVRNRRIVALLGLWKLDSNHNHYQHAIREAKAALDAGMPKGTKVVARFCLAKEALRDPKAKSREVIADFVEAQGGKQASGPALAAAALLSLDVADRERYEEYRALILARYPEHPMMWTFVSFLLDPYLRYWMFRFPFVAGWTYGRRQQWDLSRGDQDEVVRHVEAELQTLEGKPYRLPEDCKGKWTAVLFTNSWVEDKKSQLPSTVTRYLNPYIEKRGLDDLQVVVAVVDGEVAPIQEYLKEKPLNCEIVTVPGGVSNPLVRQLGILNEDTGVNALLLRPDGTIANFVSEMAMTRSKQQLIPNIMEQSDEEAVMALLEKGEIEKARELIFKVAPLFDPEAVDEKGRKLKKPVYSHFHLRARAHVFKALGNNEAALADAKEVLKFLREKGGWLTLLPEGLDEAEMMVEGLSKKAEDGRKSGRRKN